MEFINVFEEIVKYYPIGINRFDNLYMQYRGIDLAEKLCSKKLRGQSYKKWKTFVEEKSEISGNALIYDYDSPLMFPSYCGSYLLDEQQIGTVLYERKIYFHVSVLAPFYTIYGLDKILKKNTSGYDEFEPIVIISPLDIYELPFYTLRNEIETNYENYNFLSFSMLKKRPRALSVPLAKVKEGQDASIFQALFSPEDITNYKTKGDLLYF